MKKTITEPLDVGLAPPLYEKSWLSAEIKTQYLQLRLQGQYFFDEISAGFATQ